MHEAYQTTSIIDKLPYTIESLAAYGNKLIVGARNGYALVYRVDSKGGSIYEVSLEQACKTFSKKPVTQLEPVEGLDILLSLSDGNVGVHELGSLKIMPKATESIGATKGAASAFAADVQVLKTLDNNKQWALKLCISAKKSVYLYYWKNSSEMFTEMSVKIPLQDIAKQLCWCKSSICVGFKREYYMIDIDSGEKKELFPIGRNLDPLITKVGEESLTLNRDNISIVINHEGQPTQKHGITWSESPSAMLYRAPYLIGILPRFIEIRTIEPRHMIQTLPLDRPRILSHTRDGALYVASLNCVWRFTSLSVKMQITELIGNKEFELALLLSESNRSENLESSFKGAEQQLNSIKNLHAFELFSQKRFSDSMSKFADLPTDPSHVIGLYSDLLPWEFRARIQYPREVEEFRGCDRENALGALIDYLTVKRAEFSKLDKNEKEIHTEPLIEGSKTMRSRRQLSQIIDTTLLKCYLEINDALVAPLLRLKDNFCHIEESETVLRANGKLDELIILYETKQLHEKALNLLLQQSQSTNAPSSLRGVERTVDYLQKLDRTQSRIIFNYSVWVMKADPEKGLSIFTDELLEKEQRLAVEKVVSFLQNLENGNKLVLQYLKHVVMEWQEANSEYHDQLVNSYREEITPMLAEYISSLPEGQSPAPAGSEGGELGDLRAQLLHFLDVSKLYRADRLIRHFPYEYFHEERAVLLGRCGHHKQALFIYVHILQRMEMAEEYCRQYYKKDEPGDCDVYVHLLSYYLRPMDSLLDARQLYSPNYDLRDTQQNHAAALKILKQHAGKVDSRKVLDLIPDDFPLSHLLPYLESIIEKGEIQKRENLVLRNLLHSEKLTIERSRIMCERVKFVVTEKSTCFVCQNKISTSSFVRHSQNSLAHLSCLDSKVMDVG